MVVVEILDQDQEVTLEEDLVSLSSECYKGAYAQLKIDSICFRFWKYDLIFLKLF